jgi:hypothetical protein
MDDGKLYYGEMTERGEAESATHGYAWACPGAAGHRAAGMYVMAVALTPVQAEFGTDRGGASLPYTLTMIGFGIGGIVMGRLADRFGVAVPVVIGAFGLGTGFVAAGMSGSLLQFALAHGLLIGMLRLRDDFPPLVADTSLWFDKHRGIPRRRCAATTSRRGPTCDLAPVRYHRLAADYIGSACSAPRRCLCFPSSFGKGHRCSTRLRRRARP